MFALTVFSQVPELLSETLRVVVMDTKYYRKQLVYLCYVCDALSEIFFVTLVVLIHLNSDEILVLRELGISRLKQ